MTLASATSPRGAILRAVKQLADLRDTLAKSRDPGNMFAAGTVQLQIEKILGALDQMERDKSKIDKETEGLPT